LYLILQGDVEVVAVDGITRATLDIDGRGSVFGEISTITGEPCTADVMAITPVQAMMLSIEPFETLRRDYPEIEIALSHLVSDRLGQQARDALCGKALGGYRVERCLSAGTMGVVYAATDTSNGSRRALKMLRHRFIFDPRVVSRFDQEVEFLRGLNHSNIVSLRGHFVAYKTRFMVLDLYDGTDLRRLLRDRGPLQESAARAVLGQIADGLRHAHRHGVLHLDLKPANILINRQGHVAISDFGLSKLIAAEACEDEAVGTPLYMPPEQFTMTDVGPHSDWYALGCIAYELLTAKRLFPSDGEDDLHVLKQRHPDQRWPRLTSSDEYRNLVAQAVQPDIANRAMDLDQIATWARDIPKLNHH
jgi:serine/threonine protein kinase